MPAIPQGQRLVIAPLGRHVLGRDQAQSAGMLLTDRPLQRGGDGAGLPRCRADVFEADHFVDRREPNSLLFPALRQPPFPRPFAGTGATGREAMTMTEGAGEAAYGDFPVTLLLPERTAARPIKAPP